MQYRRFRVPGGTYFFTVALNRRGSDLLVREIGALRRAWAQTWAERPFTTDAIVVLPDHLHAIWTLPEGDSDFSTRWRLIKSRVTQALAPGEAPLWQQRFWEHVIRDADDLARHRALCWTNPVRHGLVRRPGDWSHGSYRRDLRLGRVPATLTQPAPGPADGEPYWSDPVTPLKRVG
ncbi:REP-associated tyrosine transposase [Pseudaestuariivita atlantica]|uniref:REP-associated tyrosine transposase n=1 Tax=Pseudaestuariivita atlantica TaxID=1317121 RepID=UPI0009E5A0C5|nr:hypothetical protein [Pseudaestuariivita atlantica]